MIGHEKVSDEPLKNLAVNEKRKCDKLSDRARANDRPYHIGVDVKFSCLVSAFNLYAYQSDLKCFKYQVNSNQIVGVHTQLCQLICSRVSQLDDYSHSRE